MALGTSELLLVIRASDQASRVLRNLAGTMGSMDKDALSAARSNLARGGALVALGGGIAAIGAKALGFFADATNAAGEYDTAARRAFTQVDNGTTSLEDLKKMGLDVATTIPVALGDTQKALYDIFSTINTDTAGAQKLLTQFSRAAVGGQTDLGTATTGTLRIMNAFKIGVNDVNKVNDVMFQLVRKGVGTYSDFNTAIGRATPSAVKSGQSVENLAGMMAFLTRNGLSASMAATSAARALDAVSNPKFQANMQKMGMTVKDAQGNFKPMTQITQEISDKLANMTAPEKAQALTDLFKGAGNNVQAMRFFNLVVNNDKAFNDLTSDMHNATGAMDKAYGIMFKSPQSQVQLLTNKYDAMKVEIGTSLLPMKAKLLEILTKLMDMWLKLSPTMQKWIAIIGAAGAALMVVVGIIIMLAGAFIVLDTAVGILEVELLPLIGTVLAVIAVLVAIGVAIWAVIKYHKQIWQFMTKIWGDIVNFVSGVWNSIVSIAKSVWGSIVGAVSGPVNAIVDWLTKRWNDFSSFFSDIWGQLVGPLQQGWGEILKAAREAIDFVVGKLDEFVASIKQTWQDAAPLIKGIEGTFTNLYKGVLKPIFDMIVSLFRDYIMDFILPVWGHLVNIFNDSLPFFKAFFTYFMAILQVWWNVIKGIFLVAVQLFLGVWNAIVDVLKLAWFAISRIFGGMLDIISGTIGLIIDIFTGNWKNAWKNFVKIFLGVWELIQGGVALIMAPLVALKDLFMGVLHAIDVAIGQAIAEFLGFFDAIYHFMGPLLKFLGSLIGNILGIFGDAIHWLWDAGGDIIKGFALGILGAWNTFFAWLTGLLNGIINWVLNLFGIHSPSSVFAGIGMDLIKGLWNGILSVEGWLHDRIWDAIHAIINLFTGAPGWLFTHGKNLLVGLWNGLLNAQAWLHDRIWSAIHAITGIFGDAGSWLLNAGGDLLRGLWNGISNAAGWLKDKVMGWAGGILPGWVKNILGIKSPSRVFADIGKNLMLGLAGGIDSHAVHAVRAAVGAARTMSDAFNSNAGFYAPGLSGYAAGAAGTTGGVGGITGGGVGNQVTVPIVINTQEINPLQHAAELGTLIGARVT